MLGINGWKKGAGEKKFYAYFNLINLRIFIYCRSKAWSLTLALLLSDWKKLLFTIFLIIARELINLMVIFDIV